MLEILQNTSFYLAVLSLLTSLVILLTLGHVTNLVQRLRNSSGNEKELALLSSSTTTMEEILKRELSLELGESGASGMRMLNYVNWGFSLSDFCNQQKGMPSKLLNDLFPIVYWCVFGVVARTPPPSPPPSIGGSYLSVLNRTQPKPISMAKLIMSRHVSFRSPFRRLCLIFFLTGSTKITTTTSNGPTATTTLYLVTYSWPLTFVPHTHLYTALHANRRQHTHPRYISSHILAHHWWPAHPMHSRILSTIW